MKIFKHLMHVTMFCNDIEKSIEYYGKLGFEVILEMRVKPDDKPWNYYLRIAEGEYIELQALSTYVPSLHPTPTKVYSHMDRSMWHFALETDDLRDSIAQLQAKGIEVWKDPRKSGLVVNYDTDVIFAADGCHCAWLLDPDGNAIEIMQQVGLTMQKKFDYAD